jgi:HEAT repeat protein
MTEPTNPLLNWLSGALGSDGGLRSDGLADQVAAFVLEYPPALEDLLDGLVSPNEVVRGRSADALEKVAREQSDWLVPHLPALIQATQTDSVAMVSMHLAMLLGHLVACGEMIDLIEAALFDLLSGHGAFTSSWAITSLCILARRYPDKESRIIQHIARLESDPSIAVRTRARKALAALGKPGTPLPKGWVKSRHLGDL